MSWAGANNAANILGIAGAIVAVSLTVVKDNTRASRLARARKIHQDCQNFLAHINPNDIESIRRRQPEFFEQMQQNLSA
jgi:hypothetical protein